MSDGKVIVTAYIEKTAVAAPIPNMNELEYEPPMLLTEVREIVKILKSGTSLGNVEVTAEVIKYSGEIGKISYHQLCTKIWEEKQWA